MYLFFLPFWSQTGLVVARRGDKAAELEGRGIVTGDMGALEALRAPKVAIGGVPTPREVKGLERRYTVDGNQHQH